MQLCLAERQQLVQACYVSSGADLSVLTTRASLWDASGSRPCTHQHTTQHFSVNAQDVSNITWQSNGLHPPPHQVHSTASFLHLGKPQTTPQLHKPETRDWSLDLHTGMACRCGHVTVSPSPLHTATVACITRAGSPQVTASSLFAPARASEASSTPGPNALCSSLGSSHHTQAQASPSCDCITTHNVVTLPFSHPSPTTLATLLAADPADVGQFRAHFVFSLCGLFSPHLWLHPDGVPNHCHLHREICPGDPSPT